MAGSYILIVMRFHSVVNYIMFEKATYSALETVGNYTQVRLVSSLPFINDTEIIVSFEDVTAIGESIIQCLLYVSGLCMPCA